jgi:signal transduction histidine kinase
MPPILDLRSIFLLAAIVGLVGTVLQARGGRPEPLLPLATAWPTLALATLAQAFASVGLSLRGDVHPYLTFSLGNATQLLALGLLWLGTRRLTGHRPPFWLGVLPALLWLLACLMPGFIASQQARIGLFAPLSLALLAGTLRELLRLHGRDGLRSALDLALVIGLVLAGLVGLYAEALLVPRPMGSGWGIVGTSAAVIVAFFAVTLPFLLLAIRHEWERAAQHVREAKALTAGRAEVARLHDGLPAIIFLREAQPDGTSRLRYRGGDMGAVTGWPPGTPGAAEALSGTPLAEGPTPRGQLEHALREGLAREEWRLVQPDGGHRHIRGEMRVLGSAPGGAVEVAGYAVDVTQERLADARAAAAVRLASLGEMGAGLAHEVKQPLQALSLAAELALMGLDAGSPEVVRRKLDTVMQEAERAADIIEHVRRFARGAGEGAAPGTLALAEPVGNALRLVRSTLEEAQVEITLAMEPPPPRVLGISVVLEQVLVSLLLNARDALATRPAGAARRLRIVAAAGDEGQVTLTVADTGGGIEPAILSRLFEPFVTTKGPDRGRGLSLAAAHGMVASLGGRLTGGNEGEGAVFTLRLPAMEEAEPGVGGPPGMAAP